MNYKAAGISSNTTPCTSIPMHCPLCEVDSAGIPVTTWKYNSIQLIFTEHSDQLSAISPNFWMKILIRNTEEKSMGTQEERTDDYRKRNTIPDSEDILPEEQPG